ncbi:cytochrome c biogenesis protein ResB [Catenulispora sp. NF23]|uniref:Cytochrome c biogenesis protein ResB n=1 Tax=Catenulispora pinistramenti TaxID=2705254 RepID=A0ABS5KLQ0_9ACTN|nr:cytochrome c biogenesis protein ResB [Catenulispora pinistramenti]MBS2531490.1 cytochrome c biogenesis protein ResB [Catenulispora pinistramenti]MBS2546972.1 cytochrome c biogenesis protein ResB [Catenulispora pinistramenti]
MASPTEEMDAASLTTAPREDTGTGSVTLPRLSSWEMLRWAWRQLTSMRVALILLFLLSLAAIPGSLLPQRSANTDPTLVTVWIAKHKTFGPLLDHLQFFTVYKSVWFSSIYLLLFISLIGCILPRTWQHVKVLRKPPPAAPRNLARMPAHFRFSDGSGASIEDRLGAAEAALKKKRFRVVRGTDADGGGWVSGEKGYLREAGNLIFHLSLVGILVGFAVKGYYGYQAKVVINEGDGFSNIAMYYDDHSFGGGVDPNKVPPFGLTLGKFTATYEPNHNAPDYGQARDFTADVTYNASPTSPSKKAVVKENSPLNVDGVSVYLSSHGYSPVITVRDKTGKAIVDHQPVEFFDSGAMGVGSGIYKVKNGYTDQYGSPQDLGLSGIFIPDYPGEMVPGLGAVSLFPTASNPALVLSAYTGNLGPNPGVYTMDVSRAQRVKLPNSVDPTNPAVVLTLQPGKNTVALPNGTGTIEFDGVVQWAQFDLNHDPSKMLVFVSAIGIIAGLLGSLGIRRRRVFVRVKPAAAGQEALRVEVAGLARAEDSRLREEVRGVGRGLRPSKAGAQK